MDFFQAQDNARRSTVWLVFYFSLAVITLVVMTNLLVMFAFGYLSEEPMTLDMILQTFDWQTFGAIGVGVVTIVVVASLYKIAALSGGGATVAELLGGTPVQGNTADLKQKRLLNVVEEIAIASGTPMPQVYVLEHEPGINAFAAGYEPGDAVVAVTAGTLEKLNREQLQGVIAHEFSHILNGDMRLNIRLMGVLHGILVIGLIGYYILRSMRYSRPRRSSKNDSAGAIMILGLGLVVIGYAGTFFGNLIKAGVSRQREYLADASAVQFTRNPGGIAGALKRIGASQYGSMLENEHAAQFSHAYFSAGISNFLGFLFATHPPLEERIHRIEPNWDGDFGPPPEETPEEVVEMEPEPEERDLAADLKQVGALFGFGVAQTVGQPTSEHIRYAQDLLGGLPAILRDSVQEPHGARAVIYFMVLEVADKAVRQQQLEYLKQNADTGVYELVGRIAAEVRDFDVQYRLPLVNLALPALRQLSQSQYGLFLTNLTALIEADRKLELFEWALQKIVTHHLQTAMGRHHRVREKYHKVRQVAEPCRVLLSVVTHASRQQINRQEAYDAGARELALVGEQMIAREDISLKQLDQALDELNRLRMLEKPRVLKAVAAVIQADEQVTPVEAELFRAIAEILDCPVPPLLAGPAYS